MASYFTDGESVDLVPVSVTGVYRLELDLFCSGCSGGTGRIDLAKGSRVV